MTALAQRSADSTTAGAEPRDPRTWEAAVRRVVRADRAELVDGSRAQRHRLGTTGVRHGALQAAPGVGGGHDLSSRPLVDLLVPALRARWDADAAAAHGASVDGDDDASVLAEVMARFTGASRGRTLWVAPFSSRAGEGPALGVLATDSPLAVLALQDRADTGVAAMARVDAGEPWTALVHSVRLPLVDEHGHALRDDVAWPAGPRWCGELRGGAEVWTCGSPAVVSGLPSRGVDR
ncbi:hypothetical protein [Quadrisphaera sp. INWT6]|uniref:hypothetical protein n=1 Tax=Quadrisphaera sp. INWT6 TaxID=2596917 RepID=UPI00189231CD|nr:hypothetical protein [Quadrisphaera sp. INWT6]MBF5083212.1 phosphoenolpyruvate carboxykinase (GTP) [Quadrisphaera sp. INWT6]